MRGRLPDFIGIGAMRCATTTLFDHMARHPDIGVSAEKETDFFATDRFELGEAWYKRQFPQQGVVVGEVSPNYSRRLIFPETSKRMARVVPDVKLIYTVRDPVDRFASHYAMAYFHIPGTPEPDRLLNSDRWPHMIDASSYHRQLCVYLERFPMENILILDFDDFRGDAAPALAEVSRFLGVSTTWPARSADELRGNSTHALGGLPQWYRTLRRTPLAGAIKRRLPLRFRDRVKAAVTTSEVKTPPKLTEDILARAAEALADDAAAFRALTGRAFERWSV